MFSNVNGDVLEVISRDGALSYPVHRASEFLLTAPPELGLTAEQLFGAPPNLAFDRLLVDSAGHLYLSGNVYVRQYPHTGPQAKPAPLYDASLDLLDTQYAQIEFLSADTITVPTTGGDLGMPASTLGEFFRGAVASSEPGVLRLHLSGLAAASSVSWLVADALDQQDWVGNPLPDTKIEALDGSKLFGTVRDDLLANVTATKLFVANLAYVPAAGTDMVRVQSWSLPAF